MATCTATPPSTHARSDQIAPWQKGAQALLASLDEGYQIWSAQGRMLFANPATRPLFWLPDTYPLETLDDLLVHCVDLAGNALDLGEYSMPALVEATGNDIEPLLQVRSPTRGERWLRIRAYPITLGDETGVISACFDVTQFVRQQTQLEQQAYHDALTGLPNRLLLEDRLHQALATAQRRHEMLAVCMMDLDGFKPINDTLGHKAGDRLLQEVAYRLNNAIRNDDTAARIGGDEFALLLGGLNNPAECEQALNRIMRDINLPVLLDGQPASVSASIGVTLFPGDAPDPDQLLRHADQAMYRAKEEGKGRFHMFDPAVVNKLRASKTLLKKIKDALETNQFRLFYQPKVDCRQGRIAGLEALVRWQHPVLGLRSPGEFLPLIEQDDTIIGLGEWVITEALEQIARWQDEGLQLPVSVNIAARQFLRGNFGARFGDLLARHPPERVRLLSIEIVETAALEDVNAVSHLIHKYRQEGIHFDLDDFGTGYSSLVHLKHLEADALKIDQTFVRDMMDDPGDLTIVQGVINLARAFHLGVVAEGVEDIEHILTLLRLGCDVMQGYGLARPMPAERVADWARAFVPDPRWQIADQHFPARNDFDLLLAQVLQRHWRQRVTAAAIAPADQREWPELELERSHLFRWLEDSGLKYLGDALLISRIRLSHLEAHRIAIRLRDEIEAGSSDASSLLEEFNAACEGLCSQLDASRHPMLPT